MLRIIFCAIAF